MAPRDATTDDRLELRDLAYRSARAAARRDYEAFRSIFTEDGRVAGFPDPSTDHAPLYDMIGHDQICGGMQGLERYSTTFHAVQLRFPNDDSVLQMRFRR